MVLVSRHESNAITDTMKLHTDAMKTDARKRTAQTMSAPEMVNVMTSLTDKVNALFQTGAIKRPKHPYTDR